MIYDPKQIETTYEEIGGKLIPILKVPAGMQGPNGSNTNVSKVEVEEFLSDELDTKTEREYREYTDEGIDPQSDQILAIKEDYDDSLVSIKLDELDYQIEESEMF